VEGQRLCSSKGLSTAMLVSILICILAISTGLHVAPTSRRQSPLAARRSSRRVPPPMAAAPQRGALRARLVGVGSCAPKTRVTNVDLEDLVETSDEWIAQRTGIRCRHLLAPGEGLGDLASEAAQQALEQAGIDAADVDLVILATSSPDDLFGDAASVAQRIGAVNAVGFDLTAACSGFLFGLNTASQFLHNGGYQNAVVIGADALSRWTDWSDRNTCVLFGDGAGAVVLRAAEEGEDAGVLGYEMHSNGAGRQDLALPYGGEPRKLQSIATVTRGDYSPITMNGKEVYKFATRVVPPVLKEAMANAGVGVDDIDWLLLHQANIRIIETVATRLGMPMDKVISNLDEYGNTSAGSIPLALDQAVRSGKVKPGDVIACSGFGAGLSWGAAIIRWG